VHVSGTPSDFFLFCIWPCMTEIITSAEEVVLPLCVLAYDTAHRQIYTTARHNLLSGGNDFCHTGPYAENRNEVGSLK